MSKSSRSSVAAGLPRLLATLLLAGLAGCGQKGPLTLPLPAAAAASSAAAAAPAAR